MDDKYSFFKSLWAALQMGDFDEVNAPNRLLDEIENINQLAKIGGGQFGLAYTADRLRGVMEAMRAEFVAMNSEDLVEQAVLAGKVAPDERAEIAAMGATHGLGVLRAFIRLRRPVVTVARPAGKRGAVEISAVQAEMNRQMGVSKEQFIKYNTPPAGADRIDAVQASINAQVGVDQATFLRYQDKAAV